MPSIPNDDGQGVTSVCSDDGKRLFGVSGPANRRYHIQMLSGMTGDIQVKERLSPMVHYTRGLCSWYLLCSGISFQIPYSRQVYFYQTCNAVVCSLSKDLSLHGLIRRCVLDKIGNLIVSFGYILYTNQPLGAMYKDGVIMISN